MKLAFPISSRTSMMQGCRWTEVVVGKVKMLMRMDFLCAIKNETECFVTEAAGYEAVIQNWIAKGQDASTVPSSELAFNLNRLLYEQAKEVMEPILDKAFVRPAYDEARKAT